MTAFPCQLKMKFCLIPLCGLFCVSLSSIWLCRSVREVFIGLLSVVGVALAEQVYSMSSISGRVLAVLMRIGRRAGHCVGFLICGGVLRKNLSCCCIVFSLFICFFVSLVMLCSSPRKWACRCFNFLAGIGWCVTSSRKRTRRCFIFPIVCSGSLICFGKGAAIFGVLSFGYSVFCSAFMYSVRSFMYCSCVG